jgi:hypothetical protein
LELLNINPEYLVPLKNYKTLNKWKDIPGFIKISLIEKRLIILY